MEGGGPKFYPESMGLAEFMVREWNLELFDYCPQYCHYRLVTAYALRQSFRRPGVSQEPIHAPKVHCASAIRS